eukprot:781336-Alexandrium_andersonii.AAC.1
MASTRVAAVLGSLCLGVCLAGAAPAPAPAALAFDGPAACRPRGLSTRRKARSTAVCVSRWSTATACGAAGRDRHRVGDG